MIAYLAATLVAGLSPLMAADTAGTVTEAVNEVSHGSASTAITTPAKTGTVIQDGEYLKTGAQSRAELELANQSITRLGSNTIFNYSTASNEVDLQAGTILFSKPKDGKEMTIKTASVTAAIVGTTGFISVNQKEKSYIFGLVEGHAKVTTASGKGFDVGPGQLLRLMPNGTGQLAYYNLPVFLKTSPLITKYKAPLPNQVFIDKEVRKYNDFAARGFVAPPTENYVIPGGEAGFVPIMNIPSLDTAHNAQQMFNMPPPPPPMSTNNPG